MWNINEIEDLIDKLSLTEHLNETRYRAMEKAIFNVFFYIIQLDQLLKISYCVTNIPG